MSDTQWPRYYVFAQMAANRPHENFGTVHAADSEMALLNARDVFVRRPHTENIWVARADDVFTRTAEQLAVSPIEASHAGGELEPYAVFCKTRQAGTHVFAGTVAATTPADALTNAIATFDDLDPVLVWWVIREAAITCSDPADVGSLFAPAHDKPYRMPQFYQVVSQLRELRRNADDS